MKVLNRVTGLANLSKAKVGAVLALVTAAATPAFAVVPAEVTTAITEAKGDALIVGAAVLVVIVAIYALKLLRKAL